MVSFIPQNPTATNPALVSSSRSLVVISDCPNLAAHLGYVLSSHSIEVSHYSFEMLEFAALKEPFLIVLDISPEQIPVALQSIRSMRNCVDIPILVEAQSVIGQRNVSRLLNRFRAMPCSHADLMKLVQRLAINKSPGEPPALL